MSIAHPARSPASGASQLAILLLTVETAIALLIHAPKIPVVSANMLLVGLFLVFVATIILCRMPLPASVRATLIMALFTLILSVGAKSDPFHMSKTDNAFSASTTDRDRLNALPVPHIDDPHPGVGTRILFSGNGGDALAARIDRSIGEHAAGDLTINADVTMFHEHGGGYSVAWSVARGGRSVPCGRLTLFQSQYDDRIAQMSRAFETALDQSTQADQLVCY